MHAVEPDVSQESVVDSKGNAYRLGAPAREHSAAQLRWCRRSIGADGSEWQQIGLRDVVAALESYEPMRTLTERAIACHRHDSGVLLTRLCSELERLCTSPIVLNRALREAVLDAIDHRGMSMSEIALRCGIVKHDRRGKASGETSWLARRVGIMPEGGETEITPWVHSDVLAVIARKGLGISPREVELQ
jgi:AraC-like DNA-binding protein